jgi:hypothetical protein
MFAINVLVIDVFVLAAFGNNSLLQALEFGVFIHLITSVLAFAFLTTLGNGFKPGLGDRFMFMSRPCLMIGPSTVQNSARAFATPSSCALPISGCAFSRPLKRQMTRTL